MLEVALSEWQGHGEGAIPEGGCSGLGILAFPADPEPGMCHPSSSLCHPRCPFPATALTPLLPTETPGPAQHQHREFQQNSSGKTAQAEGFHTALAQIS